MKSGYQDLWKISYKVEVETAGWKLDYPHLLDEELVLSVSLHFARNKVGVEGGNEHGGNGELHFRRRTSKEGKMRKVHKTPRSNAIMTHVQSPAKWPTQSQSLTHRIVHSISIIKNEREWIRGYEDEMKSSWSSCDVRNGDSFIVEMW
jgi:hypothetical protein